MTTTLERPREVLRERDEFREFLEAHDELDTLATDVAERLEEPTGPPRDRWVEAALVVLALLVVATVAFVVATMTGGGTDPLNRAGETEDQALERLVAEGYVPAQALQPATQWTGHVTAPRPETLDTPDRVLARLVQQGYVPAQALQTTATPDEATATFDLVNRGLVPAATLATFDEAQATHDLVNRGLVPAGTLPTAAVADANN